MRKAVITGLLAMLSAWVTWSFSIYQDFYNELVWWEETFESERTVETLRGVTESVLERQLPVLGVILGAIAVITAIVAVYRYRKERKSN